MINNSNPSRAATLLIHYVGNVVVYSHTLYAECAVPVSNNIYYTGVPVLFPGKSVEVTNWINRRIGNWLRS